MEHLVQSLFVASPFSSIRIFVTKIIFSTLVLSCAVIILATAPRNQLVDISIIAQVFQNKEDQSHIIHLQQANIDAFYRDVSLLRTASADQSQIAIVAPELVKHPAVCTSDYDYLISTCGLHNLINGANVEQAEQCRSCARRVRLAPSVGT